MSMEQRRERLAILGATGSIGTQTLEIVAAYPERFEAHTLTAHSNWELLAQQAITHEADTVVIADERYYTPLKEALSAHPIKVYAGEEALLQVVQSGEVDTVLTALVGYSGLRPTVEAIRSGKKIALANKESLVVAGETVMRLAAEYNVPILPVDSEHSAIFQCLVGEVSPIEKVILTASGGPFRAKSLTELHAVTVSEALDHPSWKMGAKVTIDSATLMNKGFEVIEARWLFDLRPEQIEVLIHPGSVVHSFVQFGDGSIKAQLGTPDMRLPIQYALSFPQRLPLGGDRLDFAQLGSLHFEQPDTERFPNLALAYEVLRTGGNAGAVLNAANEVGVAAFLAGEIPFTRIATTNQTTLERVAHIAHPTLEEYAQTDSEARRVAAAILANKL